MSTKSGYVSLTSWCNYHRLPKASVYRKCKDLGIDVSGGLSPENEARLEAEFGLTKKTAVESPAAVTVDVGNHQIVLPGPQLPQAYSLEPLRTGEAIEIADPLAVAASFLQTAEVLKTAMQNDIHNRQQRLNQTKQARDAIAEKAQELSLEARLYQLQVGQLDIELSTETQQLQEDLGKLRQFTNSGDGGRSASPSSEPPPSAS